VIDQYFLYTHDAPTTSCLVEKSTARLQSFTL